MVVAARVSAAGVMAPRVQLSLEIQLAQRLAGNEQVTRDRAVRRLRKYIVARTQQAAGWRGAGRVSVGCPLGGGPSAGGWERLGVATVEEPREAFTWRGWRGLSAVVAPRPPPALRPLRAGRCARHPF